MNTVRTSANTQHRQSDQRKSSSNELRSEPSARATSDAADRQTTPSASAYPDSGSMTRAPDTPQHNTESDPKTHLTTQAQRTSRTAAQSDLEFNNAIEARVGETTLKPLARMFEQERGAIKDENARHEHTQRMQALYALD